MIDSERALRGAGLVHIQRSLHGIQQSSLLEELERRFAEPPPPYCSGSSVITTETHSPEPFPGNEISDDMRKTFRQLKSDHIASRPAVQFEVQRKEKMIELWQADPATRSLPHMPLGIYEESARDIVIREWKAQGIYNHDWDEKPGVWRWRHEASQSIGKPVVDPDGRPSHRSFSFESPVAGHRPAQTDKPPDEIFRRNVTWEGEYAASRPIHQFFYQLSKACEHGTQAMAQSDIPLDINTILWEDVMVKWKKQGIWDHKWGTVPGLVWGHERSFKQYAQDHGFPYSDEVEDPSEEAIGAHHDEDDASSKFTLPASTAVTSGVGDKDSRIDKPLDARAPRTKTRTKDSRRAGVVRGAKSRVTKRCSARQELRRGSKAERATRPKMESSGSTEAMTRRSSRLASRKRATRERC